MKPHIDLDKAADAEVFGVFAIRSGHIPKRSQGPVSNGRLTPAQARALAELAHTFLKVAREASAEQKRVVLGDVSLDLRKNGSEEILSIRAAVAK